MTMKTDARIRAAYEPVGAPGEPLDLVGKVKLVFARLRAVGAIPEACDLAWRLCIENEKLKAELEALRAAGAARPQPLENEHASSEFSSLADSLRTSEAPTAPSMALVDLVGLKKKSFILPMHGHSTCAADPEVVKWFDVLAAVDAGPQPLDALKESRDLFAQFVAAWEKWEADEDAGYDSLIDLAGAFKNAAVGAVVDIEKVAAGDARPQSLDLLRERITLLPRARFAAGRELVVLDDVLLLFHDRDIVAAGAARPQPQDDESLTVFHGPYNTREQILHRRVQRAESDVARLQKREQEAQERLDDLARRFESAIEARERAELRLRELAAGDARRPQLHLDGLELIREIYQSHRDKDSADSDWLHDRGQVRDVPCDWCVSAKRVLDAAAGAPADGAEEEEAMKSEPTPKAVRACAEWLAECVRLGWPKAVLDDFEALWWKYHDAHGNLITAADGAGTAQRTGDEVI